MADRQNQAEQTPSEPDSWDGWITGKNLRQFIVQLMDDHAGEAALVVTAGGFLIGWVQFAIVSFSLGVTTGDLGMTTQDFLIAGAAGSVPIVLLVLARLTTWEDDYDRWMVLSGLVAAVTLLSGFFVTAVLAMVYLLARLVRARVKQHLTSPLPPVATAIAMYLVLLLFSGIGTLAWVDNMNNTSEPWLRPIVLAVALNPQRVIVELPAETADEQIAVCMTRVGSNVFISSTTNEVFVAEHPTVRIARQCRSGTLPVSPPTSTTGPTSTQPPETEPTETTVAPGTSAPAADTAVSAPVPTAGAADTTDSAYATTGATSGLP